MDYNKLLEEYDDMVLYSTIMLPECIEDIVIDIRHIMNIDVDRQEVEQIIKNEDIIGPNKVGCFISEYDKRKFIYIDCQQKSDLYQVCIRCLKGESNEIKRIISKWYDITADEYGLPKGNDLIDWMHDDEEINPLLDSLEFNRLI